MQWDDRGKQVGDEVLVHGEEEVRKRIENAGPCIKPGA